MVAGHPGLGGRDAEQGQRVPVDHLVGLAGAELPLDDDRVEIACEVVPLDLVALLARVAVRHEGERNAPTPEPLEGPACVGEEADRLPAAGGEVPGQGGREAVGGDPEARQRARADPLPGAQHVDALAAVARGIRPEPGTD